MHLITYTFLCAFVPWFSLFGPEKNGGKSVVFDRCGHDGNDARYRRGGRLAMAAQVPALPIYIICC